VKGLVIAVALAACGKSDKPAAEEDKPSVRQRIEDKAHALEDKAKAEAKELRDQAGSAYEDVKERANKAIAEVGPLQNRMIELEKQIATAVDNIAKATSDETRATAVQALEKLRLEKADVERKIAEIKSRI
jgi:DNA anti-recombination protein RmuC